MDIRKYILAWIVAPVAIAAGATSVRAVPPRDPSRWNEYITMLEESRMADSINDCDYSRTEDETVAYSAPRRLPAPRTFTPRILVIMAQFTDYSFSVSRADVDSMFNGEQWRKDDAKGSVRKYFYDQSNGAYNPQFDIVGPITLDKSYTAYPGNKNGATLTRDACLMVDDSINFAQYDSDNNGTIDLVFVYFAGFGQNDPPDQTFFPQIKASTLIWPHYSNSSIRAAFDGKTLSAFECANELDGYYSTATQKVISGIGVLVHEFCHGLGIPDMYTTNNTTHKTLGMWSIMDYGPYNDDMHCPPNLTAYERWYLGWLQPTHLTTNGQDTLPSLSDAGTAYYATEDLSPISNILAPAPSVFYLIENRQRTGWDRGLPGHGMMITKVQYYASSWSNNMVNNSSTAMGVDILEADGLRPTKPADSRNNGYYGKQGDCYPYNSQNCTIGNNGLTLSNIVESQGTIYFTVEGGENPITTLAPIHQATESVEKVLRGGQLIIKRDGKEYDIFGHLL